MEKKLSKKQIIENYILSEIRSGHLKVGDRIPAENELVEQFGFGRQTIHNCLKNLAVRGVIDRTPGKGSFVSGKPANRNVADKMSFTDDMRSIGRTPGAVLIEYRMTDAGEYPEVMEILKLPKHEKIYYVARLRTGDGIPIALQYSYTPVRFLGDIDLGALSGSFDEYLKQKGNRITGFSTKLTAVKAEEKQMQLLGIKEDVLLRSVSVRYTGKDAPMQYTVSYYRSDLFEYTISSF